MHSELFQQCSMWLREDDYTKYTVFNLYCITNAQGVYKLYILSHLWPAWANWIDWLGIFYDRLLLECVAQQSLWRRTLDCYWWSIWLRIGRTPWKENTASAHRDRQVERWTGLADTSGLVDIQPVKSFGRSDEGEGKEVGVKRAESARRV